MTLQNSMFFVTKTSISMFIKNIFYTQIKRKTTSAPLGSTLTTTNYVINICAYIPEKKHVDRSGSVTTITFLCARALRILPKFQTLTRFLFYDRFEWKNNDTWANHFILFLNKYIDTWLYYIIILALYGSLVIEYF